MAKQVQLFVFTGRIVAFNANVEDCDYFQGACRHLFYIRLNVLYMIVLYWKSTYKPKQSVSFV